MYSTLIYFIIHGTYGVSESHFLLHLTRYDDLRVSIFHDTSSKTLKYSDTQIIKNGYQFDVFKLADVVSKPGKEGKMDYSISIYCDFSSIIQRSGAQQQGFIRGPVISIVYLGPVWKYRHYSNMLLVYCF